MKKRLNLAVVLLCTLLFTVLFYRQAFGINLLIFELTMISWLYFTKQFELKGRNIIISFLSVIATVVFTVLNHSTLSFFMNFIVFFVFIGTIISPQIESILNSIRTSFTNIFKSLAQLKHKIAGSKFSGKKIGSAIWRIRIFLIPLMIIILFISIYSWANPEFGIVVDRIWTSIVETIETIFEIIDISIIITILTGLVVSSFILLRRINERAIELDKEASDDLLRVRKDREKVFGNLALKYEYRSAIFLFVSLNVLLFGLNILDINHVWINFEWQGQFLKQFVHQGTYVLIFAIIISILLVLYFFRSNLNFYKKNKALKILCYIWLAQNAILVVSVGIRNWYYIQYFALAYKRIAVIFFLVLAIYGLYSVYMKVKGTKSRYYLTKNNAFAWMIVLVISSGFNWDRIIAKHNFENSNKSFVHLNYLSKLSDSALPYLDRPKSELDSVDIYQEKSLTLLFSSNKSWNYRDIYMSVDQYIGTIHDRKEKFKKEWEAKGILEWNYAEYNAYKEIMENEQSLIISLIREPKINPIAKLSDEL